MLQLDPEKWTVERVGAGFVILGVLLLLTGLGWAGNRALFISRAVKTEGVILSIDEVKTERFKRKPHEMETQITRYAVAEFQDAGGGRHEVRNLLPTATDDLLPGQSVAVYYDAKDPGLGFIHHWRILWLAPGIIAVLGLFITVFVGGCLWMLH